MSKPKKSKRFEYQLESVLKVRHIYENQQKEKFKEAKAKQEEEEQKEKELKDFQNEKYGELRTKLGAGQTIDFQEVQQRKGHLDVVKKQVEDQKVVVDKAQEKTEEERVELVKKVQDRRIMEINKEEKRDEWRKIMVKEDNKFLDEIATISFARKQREKDIQNEIAKQKKECGSDEPLSFQ